MTRQLTILGSTGASARQHARRRGAPSATVSTSSRSPPMRKRRSAVSSNASGFRPRVRRARQRRAAETLRAAVLAATASRPRCLHGERRRSSEIASLPEVDTVMAAIVGTAGSARRRFAAARAGKRVLLANKEALVMAGPLFMRGGARSWRDAAADRQRAQRDIPVRCRARFAGDLAASGVRRILLTASGGPFRTPRASSLHDVTPEQACAHPNWVMGRKISVDSATMMNKGLEVIEARWLFRRRRQQIEVVIHPRERDPFAGRVRRRLGARAARQSRHAHADRARARLSRAHRRRRATRSTSRASARCTSRSPDVARFPCLRLAYAALRSRRERARRAQRRQRSRGRARFSRGSSGSIGYPGDSSSTCCTRRDARCRGFAR